MNVVFDGWRVDLLILACDDHCGYSEQLHLLVGNLPPCEEPVDQVHSDVKRFILKPEVVSHGNQPVYQDLAHALSDLNLLCHVVDFLEVVFLLPSAPVVDVVGVLGAIEDNFHGLSVLPQAVWVHISNVERPRFILRTKNLLNPAKMVKFERTYWFCWAC